MPFSNVIAQLALLTASPVQADPAQVVRQSDALLQGARTVQGSYTLTSSQGGTSEIQFALDKPNSLVFRSDAKVEVFNGTEHTIALLDARTYERRNVFVYGTPFLIGYQRFIREQISGRKTRFLDYGPATYVTIGSRQYVRHSAQTGGQTVTVDIDPETKLPARWRWETGGATYDAVFGAVTLNQPVPNELFDVAALTRGFTFVPTAEERSLPALGSMASSVQGRTVQGGEFSLLTYAQARPRTVVAFVNPNDLNSVNAMRSLKNLVGRRRDVQTVYVSSIGDRARTQKFLRDNGLSGPCLDGESANEAISAYGVKLYPTLVVLDSSGTVTSRMLGYEATTVTNALAPSVTSRSN